MENETKVSFPQTYKTSATKPKEPFSSRDQREVWENKTMMKTRQTL